jgi:hypothetical protein
VNLSRVGLESAPGGTAEAWGCFYRHGVVHGRSWTGECARACTAERGCANGRVSHGRTRGTIASARVLTPIGRKSSRIWARSL